ncbi:hypothetical protein PHLCEN_2v676 [Hermanssonia centrifuga]|uniref:DUF4110 domain-containing protein n=1 Tax=Hermanssonia centrifuga TaxID=98765 RepID=A0A2R6S5H4_9APHY|nr:hypothetical protein PHLCEN_2v676 [Hermanssonia centrifuga]
MAKKKAGKAVVTKAVNKAAKKAKAVQKVERKEQKKVTKSKDELEDDDEDLEGILDKDEWRKFVSPTCPGPRSAHAVVASPAGGGKLFLFGGEFSSLHQNSFHHYRDFWCFDVSTHSWDRIETRLRPTARSGHRMAMWKHHIILFGGFYDPGLRTNYLNDLWLFDTQEYQWKQFEFKVNERKPSPRSGFSFLPTADGILLHGGYCKEYSKGSRPVGVMLEDTWFLSISLPVEGESRSSKTSADFPIMKWERRKRPSTAYAPSLRSGCTMALWTTKNMGILFGGVTDEDTSEETMDSVFYNDLYGYQMTGNGRWLSMALKKPKKKGGAKKKAVPHPTPGRKSEVNEVHKDDGGNSDGDEQDSDEDDKPWITAKAATENSSSDKPQMPVAQTETDIDDPNLTAPLPRYNAMLSVLRNTLYIYGGIFERGSREYTLDDFHSLQLDKLDKYICLKDSGVVIPTGDDESSSGEDDDDEQEEEEEDEGEGEDTEDDATLVSASPISRRVALKELEDIESLKLDDIGEKGESDIELEEAVKAEVDEDSLRSQATAFIGVAKDTTRSSEDVVSTPLPGETLAMFYARSREYWAKKAHQSSDNRGKMLRRDGFTLAQEHYSAYKPILGEVEKILAEAGLDEEEMRKGAATGSTGATGQNRNRR